MQSIVAFAAPPQQAVELVELAATAVDAFVRCDGCEGARFLRCLDEPERYLLITTWARVGDYRRAMSSPEVKLASYPLLLRCLDEPSAFAEVLRAEPGGPVQRHGTDLAEPDRTGPPSPY